MLSVIVTAEAASDRLPVLLAQLASAAVDGLVREVLIVGGGPAKLLEVLREEMGAELAPSLVMAISVARAERLLILPASLRLRSDWLESLGRHLRGGGAGALIVGEGGPFSRRGHGVLIGRQAVAGLAQPDLKRVRRQLARTAVRLA